MVHSASQLLSRVHSLFPRHIAGAGARAAMRAGTSKQTEPNGKSSSANERKVNRATRPTVHTLKITPL
eukprot:4415535-Pleurochrysis_carterae.AAC.1